MCLQRHNADRQSALLTSGTGIQRHVQVYFASSERTEHIWAVLARLSHATIRDIDYTIVI